MNKTKGYEQDQLEHFGACVESGPRDGTTNASTSCVIVPRVSENTTNPKTFNGEPFAARKATAVGGRGWIVTERKVG